MCRGETAATTTTTEGATLTFFVACFATLFFLGRWDVQSYERNKSEGAVRVSTRVHASLTLGVGCRQDAHLRFRSWFRGRPRLLGPHGLLRRCCVSLERNHMNAVRVSTREYATSSQGGRRRGVGRERCVPLSLFCVASSKSWCAHRLPFFMVHGPAELCRLVLFVGTMPRHKHAPSKCACTSFSAAPSSAA